VSSSGLSNPPPGEEGFDQVLERTLADTPAEAYKAWSRLPCGDVDDVDPTPIMGLQNFPYDSPHVEDAGGAAVSDLREIAGARTTDNELDCAYVLPSQKSCQCVSEILLQKQIDLRTQQHRHARLKYVSLGVGQSMQHPETPVENAKTKRRRRMRAKTICVETRNFRNSSTLTEPSTHAVEILSKTKNFQALVLLCSNLTAAGANFQSSL
jgi:hypothetical protein